MSAPSILASSKALRAALAQASYERGTVRIADGDLDRWDFLVPTHRGIFAVAGADFKLAVHGWFFGICSHDRSLYVFENCGHRDPETDLGRIVRFDFAGKVLSDARVLVTGLHNNCHQIAVIDGLLCLVDTANQAIRRYTLDGDPVDVKRPFPVAPPTDRTGAYVHINSIAKVAGRIALILHNGKALPEKPSEIAWLDDAWHVAERHFLPGHHCHDIVEDEAGRLWHALSREGDVLRSDGVRIPITPDKMTRGIALAQHVIAIGVSTFGPRHLRGTLNGSVVILRRDDFARLREIDLPAAPSDVIAI